MSLLPDPDDLYRLAADIDGHAEQLRQEADRLAAAADQVQWQSTAAEAFRARASGLTSQLRRAAGAVAEAATSLRRHADAVRHNESFMNRLATAAVPGLAIVEGIL